MDNTAIAQSYTPIRPAWLALRQEMALEPELPIVDAHHHLWDRPGFRYLLEDLLNDTASGHNIVATVYMQSTNVMFREFGPEAMRSVGEVEFANGAAAMTASGIYGPIRACAAIVGWANLRLGAEVEPILEALIRAAPGRLRGIRNNSVWDPDPRLQITHFTVPPNLLSDAKFREGFALLERYDLSFDAMLLHPQIDELVDLACAFPGIRIALNHLGVPLGAAAYERRQSEVFAVWLAAIRKLAACPNVVVKLGGMGMWFSGFGFHEKPEPPSSETLATLWKPYFNSCIEAFGTARCMFESNFPVDKASYSYSTLWNAFKRLSRHASKSEKAELFGGTACQFYKIHL